ncbi:MAG: hypothetical protein LLF95_11340 [Bacteroidales bacterium]|nr:hypothetical protein [Bacteroidales bacterium]
MTEKDLRLIKQAFEYTDGSDWNMMKELINQAESDQARQMLKDRQSYLYHKEESFADQL